MIKFIFAFLLSVLECLHNYATVIIVFFLFYVVFLPSRTYRIFLGDSCLILLKKQKLLRT